MHGIGTVIAEIVEHKTDLIAKSRIYELNLANQLTLAKLLQEMAS